MRRFDKALAQRRLGGTPGVQSARFLGAATPYPDRFAEIYRRLATDKPGSLSSAARFVTALAVARGVELLFETESVIDEKVIIAYDELSQILRDLIRGRQLPVATGG